jgi:hypothetical protein
VPVEGARSFHMLHRVGWRNPVTETDWESDFYGSHPCLAVKLINVFLLSLEGDRDIPPEARIESFEQMEAIVQGGSSFDYDSLRRTHPRLRPLG